MKKLMILAATAIFACTVNAASAMWGFTSDAIEDRNGDYVGSPIAATALLYLGAANVTGTDIDLTGLTLLGSADQDLVNYTYGPIDATVPLTGLASDAAGQAYTLLLVEGDGLRSLNEGDTYWMIVASGVSARGVNPMDDTDHWAMFLDATDYVAGDWQNLTVVPEPTSGLLMLLGMAGLALRRRRA